jgi:hypothetical protein
MIEPNTEADPAAILMQFFAAFGSLVGRGPHVKVEGDEHHANLNVVLVGETGRAGKARQWAAFASLTNVSPNGNHMPAGAFASPSAHS